MRSSKDPRFVSYALIAGACVLLVAIVIGNRMGSRTIFDANRTTAPEARVTFAPSVEATTASLVERLWKKEQIVRVADDPGFPDPHVTPPPPPPPPPTPTPNPQTPRPVLTQDPNSNVPVWKQTYPPSDPGPTPVGEGMPTSGATTEPLRPGASPTDPHF